MRKETLGLLGISSFHSGDSAESSGERMHDFEKTCLRNRRLFGTTGWAEYAGNDGCRRAFKHPAGLRRRSRRGRLAFLQHRWRRRRGLMDYWALITTW